MTTTVSPKYQIVIPKAVRKQLKIKPGQKMQVEAGNNGTIIIRHAEQSASFSELAHYVGSIKTADTEWGRQGLDPTVWIRRQRDDDWR
jgi:AbrB family looped-hinge helix DNA binding protein